MTLKNQIINPCSKANSLIVWDIVNKFKDVTHKFVCDIQTVLWLFALKQTSDVVVIIFSGYLITKKDYLKNFTAL